MNDDVRGCRGAFLNMFFGLIILVGLVVALAAYTSTSPTAQQVVDNLHEEQLAALPQNDAQFSDQKTADIVQDMTTGIVAVAVSSDRAEVAIAKQIPASLYALGFVFLGVGVLILALKYQAGGKKQPNITTYQREPEKQDTRSYRN